MSFLSDHPQRYAMANELHARPFPTFSAPGEALFLAIKKPHDASKRDRAQDRAHLIALLDRYGAPHPQPDATHYMGAIGKYRVKWECHTEFVTYTFFAEGLSQRAFDPVRFDIFPADWLRAAPGQCVTSALLRVELLPTHSDVLALLQEWFVPESLAVSHMLDKSVVAGSDFRIDPAGHVRMVVFADPDTGKRRIGRVVQRLFEIETYKAMSMLGLARSRLLQDQSGKIDSRLTDLVTAMNTPEIPAEDTLKTLLGLAAEIESMRAQSSFRFGATRAYEALVEQRIQVLREQRFDGRQSFAEFMMRRFDPAMRTVKATERQVQVLADHAQRVGELLRTQVEVDRSAQNQKVLESMDRRADTQLRLQQTVEGLSVVAISYYGLNLLNYVLYPLAKTLHVEKYWLTAGLTPLVVVFVWLMVRRIRKKLH